MITTANNNNAYTNDQVRAISKLPDPDFQIVYNRLLFFQRIILHSPQPLRDMLLLSHHTSQAQSYLTQISLDLQTLNKHLPISEHHYPEIDDFDAWKQYLLSTNWKSRVQRSKKACALYLQRLNTHTHMQHKFDKSLSSQGIQISFQDNSAPDTQEPDDMITTHEAQNTQNQPHAYQCDTCNLHFNTRQALHVHRWKKHHILHQAHLYTTNNNTHKFLKR